MIVRQLDETDAPAFRTLRLHALQESPEAFGSSYEETLAQPLEWVAERLRHAPERPHDFVLGAFDPDLIGMVGFARETRAKTRHKAAIWGMYVAEWARGRGVGHALMARLLAEARAQPGLEAITLLVVSTNEPAKGLYRSLGFEPYGTEERALKLGDRYYDEDLMVLRLSDAGLPCYNRRDTSAEIAAHLRRWGGFTMTTAYARRHEPVAPWADVVPTPRPVAVDALLTLPDDGHVYEVVEGVLVRMAGSGNRATTIAAGILAALVTFVRPRRLGAVTGADGVYRFPGAETGLLPDVGFYAAEKIARIVDDDKPIPFAPDLAVEVASPSQSAEDMAAKARLYLRGGTRLVWVVWPHGSHIDVWRAGQPSGVAVTLHLDDSLDGEDVVRGFSHPVADIFADPFR